MLENTKIEAWRRLRTCIYSVFVLRAEKVTFSRQFRFNTNTYKTVRIKLHTRKRLQISSLYIQYLLTLFKWKVRAKRQTLIQEVLVPFAQQLTVQTASSKILI